MMWNVSSQILLHSEAINAGRTRKTKLSQSAAKIAGACPTYMLSDRLKTVRDPAAYLWAGVDYASKCDLMLQDPLPKRFPAWIK